MPFDDYRCWECGKPVTFKRWEPQKRVFCDECAEKHKEEHERTVAEYVRLKIIVMYERALRIMESANCYMHEYIDIAPMILKDAEQHPDRYMSSDEMIAAMVLTSNGYDFEMQYRVGRYNVDFFIPEITVCLEIDGDRHDFKEDYDSKRDIDIRAELGQEWEVIRIPTKYLEDNPERLAEAIEKSYEQKKRFRENNGGMLPFNYSKREKQHYKKAMVYKTETVRKV